MGWHGIWQNFILLWNFFHFVGQILILAKLLNIKKNKPAIRSRWYQTSPFHKHLDAAFSSIFHCEIWFYRTSVTRRLNCLFNFSLHTWMKICPIAKTCQSRLKHLQNNKCTLKNIAKDFWKCAKVAKITPNLVTLQSCRRPHQPHPWSLWTCLSVGRTYLRRVRQCDENGCRHLRVEFRLSKSLQHQSVDYNSISMMSLKNALQLTT